MFLPPVPIPPPPPLLENNELIEGVLKGCDERVLGTCARDGAPDDAGAFTDEVDGVEQCRNSEGELGGGWENRFWWWGACCEEESCWVFSVLAVAVLWRFEDEELVMESLLPECC